MVIPFLPEATLDAHPAFARLSTYITTEVLEDDASRKSVNQEEERVEGWRARVDAARRALRDLAASARKPEDDDGYALHSEHSREDDGRVAGPGKGTIKEEDKEKLRFEEALNNAKVETMRMEILGDVLRDIAYFGNDDKSVSTKARVGDDYNSSDRLSTSISHTSHSKQLTPRLRDELLVISAYIDAKFTSSCSTFRERSAAGSGSGWDADKRQGLLSLDGDGQELLEEEDISRFKENISTIADVVGKKLVEIESGLAELAGIALDALDEKQGQDDRDDQHVDDDICYDEGGSTRALERERGNMKRATPTPADRPPSKDSSLFSSLTAQTDHLATLRQRTLPIRLRNLSGTLTTLLGLQRDLLSRKLRTLEATKHGVVSRHAQARRNFFATVARAMDLKTRVLLLEERAEVEMNEHAEARTKLINQKMAELDAQEERLDGRIEELQAVLDEYGRAGEDAGYGRDDGVHVMTRLGRKYGAVEREMEAVRADIARLEARTRTRTA
ncbi:hypothetical protein LTR46_004948 [Exophiala xenobiotica]|nr:hypothetical protein LTR46_004948 [Exophiala xenobiotica]